MSLRIAGAVMVAVLFMSGCSKPTASSEPPATNASPTATPTAAPTPTGDTADVVPVADLLAITLPVPKNVPASGAWIDVPPSSAGGGDRLVNFVDGNAYWMSIRFLDCNKPVVKRAANEAPDKRGDFAACYDAPTAKLGAYPMFLINDVNRVVKVGRLIVIAGIGLAGQTTLKPADLEAYLKSLDLAAIAKL